MLQNPVRATDLEFPDQTEVLPSPSSSIVHLGFQIAQLGLLCLAHHLQQFTTQFGFFQIKTKSQSSFSECLFLFVGLFLLRWFICYCIFFSDLLMLEYMLNLTSVFASKKVTELGWMGTQGSLTEHKYIHPFSSFAIFGGGSHLSILESWSNSSIITNFITLP